MYKDIILSDELDESYLQSVNRFIEEWMGADKTINVQTSGSTGKPKELKLQKKYVRISAQLTGMFFNFKKGQRILLSLSPNYIAGKLIIVRAIEHGMKLVIGPNNGNPLEGINVEEGLDFGAFVPYQLRQILENSITRKKYEAIKNVIIGGAPMDGLLEHSVQEMKNQTYATFGMTETITHFALKNISQSEQYFTCLNGVTVEQDERGCLVLSSSPLTNEKIITNDLIELRSNHKFKWKGRIDNVVNSGGVKLSPELIEQKVASILTDFRFYFVGRSSEKLGQEIVLYVECKDQPENWGFLMEQMNKVLSKFERPKAVFFRAKFHETPTGKVKRNLL